MSRRSLRSRATAVFATLATASAVALSPAAQAQPVPVPAPLSAPVAQAQAQPAAPAADSVEGRLLSATDRHLHDMGHRADPQAWDIAAQWAGQALTGQVQFFSGVGRGVTHNDIGTGNVYRFTVAEAEARIQWLDRDANTSPQGQRFGVATARQGDTVYLVEYFLH